jgi:predicted deacylase
MKRIEHPLLSPGLGSSRQLCSLHFGSAGQGQKVYIQAALHADELPGMLVAWHLKSALQALEATGHLHGEVVLVPQANPIGHDQTLLGLQLGRFEMASGENFNRNYPALLEAVYQRVKPQLSDDAAANTRLIRAAIRTELAAWPVNTELQSLRHRLMSLAADADIVLDLHCDFRAALHVYTGTPLWPQCEPLSRYLGSQAQLLATESGGDPFDEACSRIWWELQERARQDGLDVPIELAALVVTVELRGQGDVRHELAERDAAAILEFLRYRGLIADRPAAELPPLDYPATPLAGSENLCAPHSGVVTFLVAPGTQVEPGQPVVEVIDPLNDRVSVLSSAYGGMVYVLESRHFATTGMGLAKVATPHTFKTGSLLSA